MSADPIIYCLEHLTDYRQFERLCFDLMAGSGYPDIEPLGGASDRGRDALHHGRGQAGVTLFAFTVREDWKRKLLEDCNRLRLEKHQFSELVFVCTSSLTAQEKDEAVAHVKGEFGWDLKIYDLERIRVLLAGELRHLLAQHPAIFCPPWFPQVAGMSIAEARDTLVIDHVPADHALATWLARRLSLAGFRTWCYGTAPLAGENADASVRLLIQRRARLYLPILSPESLADREFHERCIVAEGRDGLVLPCWAAVVADLLEGSRLSRLEPARFQDSWATGLNDVLAALKARGVVPDYKAVRGRAIALRAYVPEPVTKPGPERVLTNVFQATVPSSILVYKVPHSLPVQQIERIRETWPFVIAAARTLLSFHEPPASRLIPGSYRDFEFAWDTEEHATFAGRNSIDIMKELLRRSLDVACVRAGLVWCPDRKVYYFPQTEEPHHTVYFEHVDGRRTHVALTGERQYGFGERATRFRYQLAPRFRVGRDDSGQWWVTTRIYIRVTDLAGIPFQGKAIIRRRKAVTRSWWNKEWLARTLGVMHALSTDQGVIRIGEGHRAVTVSTSPLEWSCPVALDTAALERIGDFQAELAAIRDAYLEDEEEDATEAANDEDDSVNWDGQDEDDE